MKRMISALLATIIVFSSAVSLLDIGDLSAEAAHTHADGCCDSAEETTSSKSEEIIDKVGTKVSNSLTIVGSDKEETDSMVAEAKAKLEENASNDVDTAKKDLGASSTGAESKANSTGADTVKITLKYYERTYIDGEPADISDVNGTYSTYSKNCTVAEYTTNGTINFEKMISETAVELQESNKAIFTENLLDEYYVFTSQSNADTTMKTIPNLNSRYEGGTRNTTNSKDNIHYKYGYHYNGSSVTSYDVTYHTDRYGVPQIGNVSKNDNNVTVEFNKKFDEQKWVTCYNGSTEVAEPGETAIGGTNITDVVVWLYNRPKSYTVKVHQVTDDNVNNATLVKYGSKDTERYVTTEEETLTTAYYNQRLGKQNTPFFPASRNTFDSLDASLASIGYAIDDPIHEGEGSSYDNYTLADKLALMYDFCDYYNKISASVKSDDVSIYKAWDITDGGSAESQGKYLRDLLRSGLLLNPTYFFDRVDTYYHTGESWSKTEMYKATNLNNCSDGFGRSFSAYGMDHTSDMQWAAYPSYGMNFKGTATQNQYYLSLMYTGRLLNPFTFPEFTSTDYNEIMQYDALDVEMDETVDFSKVDYVHLSAKGVIPGFDTKGLGTVYTSEMNSKYYPKPQEGKDTPTGQDDTYKLTDYLGRVMAIDLTEAYLERLYKENGIEITTDGKFILNGEEQTWTKTIEMHSYLLGLANKGKLINPDYFEYSSKYYYNQKEEVITGDSYFVYDSNKASATLTTLVKNIYGITDDYEAYAKMARIARVNGYNQNTFDFTSTTTTPLVTKYKNNVLIDPDKVGGCEYDDWKSREYFLPNTIGSDMQWALSGIGVVYSQSLLNDIAIANGISNPSGYYESTLKNNSSLLNLFKTGKLKNPYFNTSHYSGRYMPETSGSTILEVLSTAKGSTWYGSWNSTNMVNLAAQYGMSAAGSATQNQFYVELINNGILLDPDHTVTCDCAPGKIISQNFPWYGYGTSLDNYMQSQLYLTYYDEAFVYRLAEYNNVDTTQTLPTIKSQLYAKLKLYSLMNPDYKAEPYDCAEKDVTDDDGVDLVETGDYNTFKTVLVNCGVDESKVTIDYVQEICKTNNIKYVADSTTMYAELINRIKLSNLVRPEYDPYYSEHADTQSEHLVSYNILAYTNCQTDTVTSFKSADGTELKFSYWSFDPDGATIASTNIHYNYRITNNTDLYAVYQSGAIKKKGLTISNSGVEVYKVEDTSGNEISKTRLNSSMNPYNLNDDDVRIMKSAVIYVIADNNVDTTETLKLNKSIVGNVRSRLHQIMNNTAETTENAEFVTDSHEGREARAISGIDNIKGANFFVYNNPKLTNKNRMQFVLDSKTSQLENRRMLAFTAMYFDVSEIQETSRTYEWVISDNCIDYSFDANGKCISKAANGSVSGNTNDSMTELPFGSYALVGLQGDGTTTAFTKTSNDNVVEAEMKLSAGTYNFYVQAGNENYGHLSAQTDTISNLTLTTDNSKIPFTANGGTYKFTYTIDTHKLNVTYTPDYYITGLGTSDIKLALSNGVASTTVEIAKGTYTFKVKYGTTVLGNNSAINDSTSSLPMNLGETCTLHATGGKYTFSYNVANKTLDVTCVPYYYIVINGTEYKMDVADGVATTSLDIAEDTYNFTVKYQGNSYGNATPINDETTGLTLSKDVTCKLTATGGTYRFAYTIDTKNLVVEYIPEAYYLSGINGDIEMTKSADNDKIVTATVNNVAEGAYTISIKAGNKTYGSGSAIDNVATDLQLAVNNTSKFNALGGNYVFAYNTVNKTLTITFKTSCYVVINGEEIQLFDTANANEVSGEVKVAYGTPTLRIKNGGALYGNSTTVTNSTSSALTVSKNTSGTLKATGGKYTFVYNIKNHALTISYFPDRYYPACSSSCTTLAEGLADVFETTNAATIQSQIAPLYNLNCTTESNLQADYFLDVLKDGRLINPAHVNSDKCSCTAPYKMPTKYYPAIPFSTYGWYLGRSLENFGHKNPWSSTTYASMGTANNLNLSGPALQNKVYDLLQKGTLISESYILKENDTSVCMR